MIRDDMENVLVMETAMASVGKTRNYGATAKDLEEERRQVEIRLREKEEACQTEAKHRTEEEDQRAQREEERVRKHSAGSEGS